MAAKSVQVSTDNITYYTLPGGTGKWDDAAAAIDDTIFGQNYKSSEIGLIKWTASANALYKGFAGYVAKIRQSGISTAVVAEPMSLVSGKTYKTTAAAKNVWDWTVVPTIKDNAITVAPANIASYDYLFGRVTFVSGYSVTGAITFDGNYLPMSDVAKADSFTLTQTAAIIDHTDFPTAQANGGYMVAIAGLKTVGLELGGFYDVSSAFWTVLEGRSKLIIEINPDGSSLSVARGIFKLANRGQSGNVGALETETRKFELSIPAGIDPIFNWVHDAATTLSTGIQLLLTAWLAGNLVYVRYEPDGIGQTGFTGQAVISDVTLKSGLAAMNDFTAAFEGSGAPVRGVISD